MQLTVISHLLFVNTFYSYCFPFVTPIVQDTRGGLPMLSDGDKSYAIPEYSYNFHHEGSTLPVINFRYLAVVLYISIDKFGYFTIVLLYKGRPLYCVIFSTPSFFLLISLLVRRCISRKSSPVLLVFLCCKIFSFLHRCFLLFHFDSINSHFSRLAYSSLFFISAACNFDSVLAVDCQTFESYSSMGFSVQGCAEVGVWSCLIPHFLPKPSVVIWHVGIGWSYDHRWSIALGSLSSLSANFFYHHSQSIVLWNNIVPAKNP